MTHPEEDGTADRYDVIVVGGGAAGLSGAKILARSRRSVLLVDAGAPRNGPAAGVHNYLYAEGASPAWLRETGHAEARRYGVEVVEGTARRATTNPEPASGGPGFVLSLRSADGLDRQVSARRLLLATGLVDGLPPVPGMAERWGKDVLHCPFCHGWEVRDQPVGVVGTTTMGPVQARLFRQLTPDLIYFQHIAPDLTPDQRDELAALGVEHVTGKVAAVETDSKGLSGVRMADGRFVPRRAVVVATTLRARQDLLGDLGLAVTEQTMGGSPGTFLQTGGGGATAVPGVWAAGNLSAPMVQVVDAAAGGAGAGAAIHMDLLAEDTARAVAAYRRRAAPAARAREVTAPATAPAAPGA